MATYNIYEAKAKFSMLVNSALMGEEVVIARDGEPLLSLVPLPSKKPARRRFGSNFLEIRSIAEDFYDDLPADSFEVLRDEKGSEG